jgi:phage N-6-adenine-methyltransferase
MSESGIAAIKSFDQFADVRIDPELRDLIPPLSREERVGLESSLKSEGCRDAIVVWNKVIIDGHNRYEICTANGIPFRLHSVNLPDRDAAIDWMYSNQLSRRNLTDTMRTVLIGKQYTHRKKSFGGQGGNRFTVEVGQNDPPVSTAEKIAQEQGVSEKTVKRAEKLADAIETIRDVIGPEAESAILKETVKLSQKEIIDKAQELKEAEPEKILEIKESVKQSGIKNAGLFTSETDEWYTPKEILDSVIEVFGEIDLDPCSNNKDSPNVPANSHFTYEDNGLTREWKGTVYMNPPYGREIVDWVDKLLSEWEKGNIEAIALVPARTDTAWFAKLDAHPWCAVRGRLKFSNNPNSAPFPSAVFYLGRDEDEAGPDRFVSVFLKHGTIFQRL